MLGRAARSVLGPWRTSAVRTTAAVRSGQHRPHDSPGGSLSVGTATDATTAAAGVRVSPTQGLQRPCSAGSERGTSSRCPELRVEPLPVPSLFRHSAWIRQSARQVCKSEPQVRARAKSHKSPVRALLRQPFRGRQLKHPAATPDRALHTGSPVLLLIVARVLWTARPPVRPVLGAEATTAAPAGPITFRCPLAVRSTRPPAPARQQRSPWLPWSATVSGSRVASAPCQVILTIPGTRHGPILDSALPARKPHATARRRRGQRRAGEHGWWRFALGPRWVRGATVVRGRERSPTVTDGADKLQVAGRLAQAAGMMRVGDSDCGPEGRGFESPRSP